MPGGAADTMGIALARYLPSGTLAPSFGTGGLTLKPPVGANTALGASGAALGECTILVTGTWGYNVNTAADDTAIGVARFRQWDSPARNENSRTCRRNGLLATSYGVRTEGGFKGAGLLTRIDVSSEDSLRRTPTWPVPSSTCKRSSSSL